MNTSIRIIAISAITALSSFAAFANGEGDNAPERNIATHAAATTSMKSGAQMKSTQMPVRTRTGSMGGAGSTDSSVCMGKCAG